MVLKAPHMEAADMPVTLLTAIVEAMTVCAFPEAFSVC